MYFYCFGEAAGCQSTEKWNMCKFQGSGQQYVS